MGSVAALEFKSWLLLGIVTIVGGILIRIVNAAVNKAVQKLEEVVKNLNQISVHLNTHEQQIINMSAQNNNTSNRLNDHSVRIRALEQDVLVIKSKNK